jgi:plasmid stabilization system protein ParE
VKFAVYWLPRAKKALAKAWVESKDRRSITAAADALDSELAASPYDVGESREDVHLRFTVEGPLRVFFQVFEAEKRVIVVRVRV